jgi:hypothetical protein
MSIFLGTRVGSARFGNALAITRCDEPVPTSRVGKDFRPSSSRTARCGGPRVLAKLGDDEGMPLICPTCQVWRQAYAGDGRLLCMGLFSIFLVGSEICVLR